MYNKTVSVSTYTYKLYSQLRAKSNHFASVLGKFMSETLEVLNRLATALNAKNDAELARKLEVNTSTIATWKARNTIPYKLCVEIAKREKVSLDWLLTGEQSLANATLTTRDCAIIDLFRALDDSQQQKIYAFIQDEKRIAEMREQLNQLLQLQTHKTA